MDYNSLWFSIEIGEFTTEWTHGNINAQDWLISRVASTELLLLLLLLTDLHGVAESSAGLAAVA